MTRILLVEDEEKLARFVELELTHEGYQVDKAFDGRTGLDQGLCTGRAAENAAGFHFVDIESHAMYVQIPGFRCCLDTFQERFQFHLCFLPVW